MCQHLHAVEIAKGEVSCQKCAECNEVFIRCVCGGKMLSLPPSSFFMKCEKCGEHAPKQEIQLPLFRYA